jgi:hypothetical protein
MDVTQWCDDVSTVQEIVLRGRDHSLSELLRMGCHWVPATMPATAEVVEVVEEYEIGGGVWELVRIRIDGAEKDGFTLVRR